MSNNPNTRRANLTQDFLNWEEDEGNDLQKLFCGTNTSISSAQYMHTPSNVNRDGSGNDDSGILPKEVEKEVNGIFSV